MGWWLRAVLFLCDTWLYPRLNCLVIALKGQVRPWRVYTSLLPQQRGNSRYRLHRQHLWPVWYGTAYDYRNCASLQHLCSSSADINIPSEQDILVMLGSATTVSSYTMAKSMGHEGTLSASVIMLITLLSAFSLTGWLFLLKTMQLI